MTQLWPLGYKKKSAGRLLGISLSFLRELEDQVHGVLTEYESSSHFFFFLPVYMKLTLRVAKQNDRMNLFLINFEPLSLVNLRAHSTSRSPVMSDIINFMTSVTCSQCL